MLLERDKELELMADLLAQPDSSGGRVVLLRGEAGIGKSALVREFMKGHSDKAHVHVGACDDLLTPQPLGPFWDIARSEPSLAEPLASGNRQALLEALMDLLTRSLRPTVLVLEDTQWADEATLDVIKYLGRRIMQTNGLLLLTYRDGEVDYDHPLRVVIGEISPQNLVRIHLDRLSAQAVATMVEDRDIDLDEVLTLAGGNPLFVNEVVASGVEDVPLSVQDSVLARATKLSPRARQLLDLVSVIPGETERSLIDNILGATEEDLVECARQGLIQRANGTVSFHHELTRRAVESALSAADRRRLNQDVLAELVSVLALADPARLVHHAREADDVESIIEFAPQAARAAMKVGSHRDALAHFRALEPYLDQIAKADRALIVDDWARSEFYLDNVGSFDILTRAIDLHRSAGDDLALARALTFAVRLNEIQGRPEEADRCSLEAIALLESFPPSPDLAFAVSQSSWLSLMRGDGKRTVELADRAIALAEEVGDEWTMIHALNNKGTQTYGYGDPAGLEMLEEARRRAEQRGYRFEETRALINMTSAVVGNFEVELAVDLAQRTRATAARYELSVLEIYAQAHYAEALYLKGDWVIAEDLAGDALGSHPHTEVVAGWVLGSLQARRGRPDAQATLDRAWDLAEASDEMQNLVPTAAAQAEQLWLTGEDDPSLTTRLREVFDEGTRRESPWRVGALAFWLWKLGLLSEIPEGIAEPYRLIMKGKADQAALIWDEKAIPFERAMALIHSDETAQIEAIQVLESLGATAVAAKLRQGLRDAGVSVPRGRGRETQDHAAGLTARQSEVLSLLAEELSNVEIADRLFLSPRTVEHHVAAVISKLDVTTRDDAVATAAEQGLLAYR